MRTNVAGCLHRLRLRLMVIGVACCTTLSMATAEEGSGEIAEVILNPRVVIWQPHVAYQSLVLTVSVPGGEVLRQEFQQGETVAFQPLDETGSLLPDGSYTYELRVIPVVDPSVKQALATARKTGDMSIVATLQNSGHLPRQPVTQTGYFSIAGGIIVMPALE